MIFEAPPLLAITVCRTRFAPAATSTTAPVEVKLVPSAKRVVPAETIRLVDADSLTPPLARRFVPLYSNEPPSRRVAPL